MLLCYEQEAVLRREVSYIIRKTKCSNTDTNAVINSHITLLVYRSSKESFLFNFFQTLQEATAEANSVGEEEARCGSRCGSPALDLFKGAFKESPLRALTNESASPPPLYGWLVR